MSVPPIGSLAGYTVAVTAERRREEFGAALARHGAQVRYAPAVRLVPCAEDDELRAATERCCADGIDFAVVLTGMGLSGWLDAAAGWGLAERLGAALRGSRILARGPKARGAVRGSGLRECWSPESESAAEVLDWLLARPDLPGARVAVQLHGDPASEAGFLAALRARGCQVIEVIVYRAAPPADPDPLRRLVAGIGAGSIDAVSFTSAAGATGFLRALDQHDAGPATVQALRSDVLCAAVGSITAAPLVAAGIPVATPGRARLGALVRMIAQVLPERREITVRAAGHALQLRGHAVLVDGAYTDLPVSAVALLRELARRPGEVVPRAQLLHVLPGHGGTHAVEAAIGRLRVALGDPAIIGTVIKRGYRLAVE